MNCCPTCKQPTMQKLLVDLQTGAMTYDGTTIKLTPRQADIMHVLWEQYPQCVTRESLADRVGGMYGDGLSIGTLKVHVSLLREKLKGLPISISRFARDGYQLEIQP